MLNPYSFRFSVSLLISIKILFFSCQSLFSADEWTQWRGPSRNGTVKGETWPESLDESHLKKLWEVKLDASYSGPIVTKETVFVTETLNKETETVRALERNSGKEIWMASWPGAMNVPFFAASNGSWIRSTPALDENRLYIAGMRDVLVCLNAQNGEIIWKIDFVKELNTPLPSFGFVCSPLVDDKFVYVQAGSGLVKLNKLTGEIIWRSLVDGGGMLGSAFSSPIIATISNRKQIVAQTRDKLAGVDLESGEVLWSQKIPAFRGMNIVSPTVIGNNVFTSSYGGGSYLYEIKSDENSEPVQVWRNKIQGYMNSPIYHDGHFYFHLRNQRFACLELATGKEKWISKPFGKYWSTVIQNDKILALDERGDLLLLRANPEKFDLIDSRHISDRSTWAHLAVVDNQIFVRTLKSQMVFQWE